MQLQVYLFFAGRCEEAIDFYKKTLGAGVAKINANVSGGDFVGLTATLNTSCSRFSPVRRSKSRRC